MIERSEPGTPTHGISGKRDVALAALLMLSIENRGALALTAALTIAAMQMRAIGAKPSQTKVAIRRVAVPVVIAMRKAARDGALARWIEATELDAKLSFAVAADQRAAAKAADYLADRWFARLRALEAQSPGARDYDRAIYGIKGRIDSVAATETASAWNAEQRAASKVARKAGFDLLHTWESELDRRTCSRCADLDGTTCRNEEDFPEGWPPLHPACRCQVSTTAA